MTDQIEVTQADREAAALWMELDGHAWSPIYIAETREGGSDGGNTVQAFARHRIVSTEALRAENARLRRLLSDINFLERETGESWQDFHSRIVVLAADPDRPMKPIKDIGHEREAGTAA